MRHVMCDYHNMCYGWPYGNGVLESHKRELFGTRPIYPDAFIIMLTSYFYFFVGKIQTFTGLKPYADKRCHHQLRRYRGFS